MSRAELDLRFKLHLLLAYENVNPFVDSLYTLYADYVDASCDATPALKSLFMDFLDLEIDHYEYLFGLDGPVPQHGEDLQRMTAAQEERLAVILHELESLPEDCPGVRDLLMAQCHYYFAHGERTVRLLSRAIRDGYGHPLVVFSLGYNLFMYALEDTDHEGGLSVPGEQRTRFMHECGRAIFAFSRALDGSPFDGQVYYWIAAVAEVTGAIREAVRAYEEIAHIDDGLFESVRNRVEDLRQARSDGGSEEADQMVRLCCERAESDEEWDKFLQPEEPIV